MILPVKTKALRSIHRKPQTHPSSLLSPTEEMRMTLESSIRLQAEAEAFAGNEITSSSFTLTRSSKLRGWVNFQL